MNAQDRQLVQSSFAKLLPEATEMAGLFYDRLFELDPRLRPLFKNDMNGQKRRLMQMLTAAVRSLDDMEELIPVLRELGARHAEYGVSDSHYDTVGYVLLWTLEKKLGDGFTPATREAWTELYAQLARAMRDAARQASATEV